MPAHTFIVVVEIEVVAFDIGRQLRKCEGLASYVFDRFRQWLIGNGLVQHFAEFCGAQLVGQLIHLLEKEFVSNVIDDTGVVPVKNRVSALRFSGVNGDCVLRDQLLDRGPGSGCPFTFSVLRDNLSMIDKPLNNFKRRSKSIHQAQGVTGDNLAWCLVPGTWIGELSEERVGSGLPSSIDVSGYFPYTSKSKYFALMAW